MSEIIKRAESGPWEWYSFWCPACNRLHPYHTKNPKGVTWTFNGDMQKPSFQPSLLVYPHSGGQKRCHLFVTGGMIQYCGDSEHELAGKTIPMVPLPEDSI